MKLKKLLAAIVVAVLATASSQAQTQTNNDSNTLTKLGQGIAALGTSTNWGWVAYGTLGRNKDKQGHQAYGGGVLGLYSLNNFISLGGGIDDITGLSGKGQVTIVSADIQAQLPMHPFTIFSTNGFAQNFTLTPYLYTGTGTPFGATINQSVVVHEGEGVNLDLVSFGNDWTVGLGYALIQRQNAGSYSGGYQDITIALHHSFK